MKTHYRWVWVFLLLFPAVAFSQPADEGTRVGGMAGVGRHNYQGGCATPINYTVEDVAVGTQVTHRDDWLRVSGGARFNRGRVTSGFVADPADCAVPNANPADCEPTEVGDVTSVTQFVGRLGFETEHLGLEIGPVLALIDDDGSRSFEILPAPSTHFWVGTHSLHLFATALPLDIDPNATFALEGGVGHVSDDLRLALGPRVGGGVPAGEITSGFVRFDRRLDGGFWLGADLSAGPSDTDRLNFAGSLRFGYHFDPQ